MNPILGFWQEREYIEREAKSQFRRNAAAHDPADVDAMVCSMFPLCLL